MAQEVESILGEERAKAEIEKKELSKQLKTLKKANKGLGKQVGALNDGARALRAALGASWAAHRAVAPPEACPWLEPAEILGAPAMA